LETPSSSAARVRLPSVDAERTHEQLCFHLLERGERLDGLARARRQTEMIGTDHVAGGEHHGARETVLQLAHVARPPVREQALHRLGSDRRLREMQLLARLAHEVPRQHGQRRPALAQRGSTISTMRSR
jgi:hypothetical protein